MKMPYFFPLDFFSNLFSRGIKEVLSERRAEELSDHRHQRGVEWAAGGRVIRHHDKNSTAINYKDIAGVYFVHEVSATEEWATKYSFSYDGIGWLQKAVNNKTIHFICNEMKMFLEIWVDFRRSGWRRERNHAAVHLNLNSVPWQIFYLPKP